MKKFYIIILIVLTGLSTKAQVNFQWVKQMGGTLYDVGQSIAVDAAGNVFTTGRFQGTVDFDPGAGVFNLTSAGDFDIFISKLDAAGNFVWAKRIGGTLFDHGRSIAVDATGNVYLTGWFQATVDFDPGAGVFNMTSPASADDIFVSKLDAAGNFVWAKQMGGTLGDQGISIAVDASGNVYTTGYFQSTVDFDPGAGIFNLTSLGSYDVFVSKLDAVGNFVWAKQMGGTSNDAGYSIAVDASGNVYTTGYFQSTVDFDPGVAVFNLTSFGNNDIFVSKLDASGNFVWAKQIGGTSLDESNSIAVDAAGNVYTTGFFMGVADFDPGAGVFNLTTNGGNDIYVSKLDAAGNFVWVKQMGGVGGDVGYSITLDATGNVYTTGLFSNSADFDPGAGIFGLSSTGLQEVFVSKLDATGNFAWARQMGGSSADIGESIAVDVAGNVYTIGYFFGTADFDPGAGVFNLTPAGGYDIFIHKMSVCNPPASPTNSTSIANQTLCSGASTTLSAVGSGTINWYSTLSSTTSLGSGTNFITPTLTAGTYTYYAEATTCTNSARTPITITVNICTGVSTNSSNENYSVLIYPNPNYGVFKIQIDNEIKNGQILLINSIGQNVYEQTVKQGINNINTTGLSSGLYNYILLSDKQKIKDGKLVVD